MIVDISSDKDIWLDLREFKSLLDLKIGTKIKILSATGTLAFKDNTKAKLTLDTLELDEANEADKELKDLKKQTDPDRDQTTHPQVDADDF